MNATRNRSEYAANVALIPFPVSAAETALRESIARNRAKREAELIARKRDGIRWLIEMNTLGALLGINALAWADAASRLAL